MRNAVYSRLERKSNIKLSVLICTVKQRVELLHALLDELDYQIQTKPVEVLWLGDNRRMTIGRKRNLLKMIAQGEWIRFVDDDDMITFEGIKRSLELIEEHHDKKVICFRGTQSENGKPGLPFRFDRKFGTSMRAKENGENLKVMVPNHLCIWKREVALLEDFLDISLSEDHKWASSMLQHYTEKDQALVNDNLYHYEFDRSVSLCRK